MEINKFFPNVKVYQQACPLWVPLIENNEHHGPGADFFVKKYISELLSQSPEMDTVLLACTHYPLLMDKLKQHFPENIKLVAQGDIVAESLVKYLKNHPEIDNRCTKKSMLSFYTTDDYADFDRHGGYFYGKNVRSERVFL
jgi:glutamate racemase